MASDNKFVNGVIYVKYEPSKEDYEEIAKELGFSIEEYMECENTRTKGFSENDNLSGTWENSSLSKHKDDKDDHDDEDDKDNLEDTGGNDIDFADHDDEDDKDNLEDTGGNDIDFADHDDEDDKDYLEDTGGNDIDFADHDDEDDKDYLEDTGGNDTDFADHDDEEEMRDDGDYDDDDDFDDKDYDKFVNDDGDDNCDNYDYDTNDFMTNDDEKGFDEGNDKGGDSNIDHKEEDNVNIEIDRCRIRSCFVKLNRQLDVEMLAIKVGISTTVVPKDEIVNTEPKNNTAEQKTLQFRREFDSSNERERNHNGKKESNICLNSNEESGTLPNKNVSVESERTSILKQDLVERSASSVPDEAFRFEEEVIWNDKKVHVMEEMEEKCGPNSTNIESEHTFEYALGSDNVDEEARRCGTVEGKSDNIREISVPRKDCKPVANTKVRKKQCLICLKEFTQSSHLQRHLQCVHNKLKPHKCSFCSTSFQNRYDLKKHLVVHTMEKQKVCKYCKQTFKQQQHVGYHQRNVCKSIPKADRIRLFEELYSSSRYKNSQNLNKKVSEKYSQRVMCLKCKKTYANMGELKRHSLIHTGERNLQCHICNYHFSRQSSLNRHIQRHCNDSKKKFQCERCKIRYMKKKTLECHKKKCNGGLMFVKNVK